MRTGRFRPEIAYIRLQLVGLMLAHCRDRRVDATRTSISSSPSSRREHQVVSLVWVV